ncbi:hypothetical protein [Cumulibacter manganitolerans]|uniref:hypothetical protein n=1 Tax=Cumulibacter manganitolerans TaxID=1884992 RepID=UPI001294C8DD|nr:hypothetical protein [Cumulibacter manganitolerans]
MAEPRPEFSTLKLGRKGYECTAVDTFVDRVLRRVNEDRTHDGMSSHELAMPLFDEARGSSAYDEDQVDAWLKEMRTRIQAMESSLHEEDIPTGREEGSVLDMGAPPHYADRFPRVSRAVLGFATAEVDQAMEQLRAAFAGGQAPTAEQILSLSFAEEQGGYRQVAVAQTLELIAMARRA